jgi:hypothetical protein
MSETRKLAAILVADIVGYSRLAGVDEDRTFSRLRGLRSDLIDPVIAAHHGRIVKRTGDGGVIDFRSVVEAVRCAIEVQTGLVERKPACRPNGASNSASGFTSATSARKPMANSSDGRTSSMRNGGSWSPCLTHPPACEDYEPASWGPRAADALIGADRPWRNSKPSAAG